MRRDQLPAVVAALQVPVRHFVHESRVRTVLLVNGAGQVLAQHGFTSSYEVMNVASLAAATHASSRALATLSGAGRWAHLYHGGREQQLFLAPLRTPVEELILVAIFDGDSSLGLVRLFYDTLEREIAALPELRQSMPATDRAGFERDLEAGLEQISPDAPSED
jgi:predicted regulator of Ras-like GTPase activity (Roadblock/LC7/MglB family)